MSRTSASSIVLQSILFEDGRLQVSWFDPAGRGPCGVEIRTAVITLEGSLDSEMAELVDAAEQLLTAWHGLMRESFSGRPGP